MLNKVINFSGYRNENKGEPCNVPWYCVLRDSSPMTLIFQQVHRNGDHRCNGDIVQTLLSMQKMNVSEGSLHVPFIICEFMFPFSDFK